MKNDGRTLTHEVSEYIRQTAVRRVQEGETPSAVIESYGLNRTTIYGWLKAAKKGGLEALRARRHPGPPCKLSAAQKQQVRRWICGKDPRQYGFDFGLWTRKIVAALVQDKMGVSLGVTAVGRMLAALEITPQKPLRRAYERDPVAVEQWKTQTYPELKKRAHARGAAIFFLDEAGLRSDDPLQRSWGAKGQTPVVKTSGQRQAINAISAVTALGAFWFAVYTGRFNATLFKQFLKDFLRGRRGPVFLVVDGHPAHKAKLISSYVQETQGRLELHFLPGYAPDLNPDEFVWHNLRQQGVSKKPLKKNESLRTRVLSDLNRIQNDKPLVRSFFLAPSVAYTTD
jgi:transposase